MGVHSLHDPQQIREADRRAVGGVRLGVVAERDLARARVRVRLDDQLLSDWLPWGSWAAGRLKVWSPPTIGEQCLVLAPSGNPESGVAMPAIFTQAGAFPAPSDSPDQTLLQWEDGGYFRYDLSAHKMTLYAPGGVWVEGTLNTTGYVTASNGLQVAGDVTATGDIKAAGDVTAQGLSLTDHIHPGVVRGGSSTDAGVNG